MSLVGEFGNGGGIRTRVGLWSAQSDGRTLVSITSLPPSHTFYRYSKSWKGFFRPILLQTAKTLT